MTDVLYMDPKLKLTIVLINSSQMVKNFLTFFNEKFNKMRYLHKIITLKNLSSLFKVQKNFMHFSPLITKMRI